MERAIRNPWNSLFARALIAAITLGHVVGFVATLRNGPVSVLVMTCFTVPFGLAFFGATFFALRITPGRRVGGLLYQTAALNPGEDALFSFPEQGLLKQQAMVFVTTERVLRLPLRFWIFGGRPQWIAIRELRRVVFRNLNEWRGMRIKFEGPVSIETKPMFNYPFMNLPRADRLPQDLATALTSVGLAAEQIQYEG